MTMDIGQAIIPTLIPISQLLVVDAHQVHDGRIYIVNMDRVLGDIITEVVGFSVSYTGPYSAARHPDGETTRMMVPSVFRFG